MGKYHWSTVFHYRLPIWLYENVVNANNLEGKKDRCLDAAKIKVICVEISCCGKAAVARLERIYVLKSENPIKCQETRRAGGGASFHMCRVLLVLLVLPTIHKLCVLGKILENIETLDL